MPIHKQLVWLALRLSLLALVCLLLGNMTDHACVREPKPDEERVLAEFVALAKLTICPHV